MTTIVLDGLYEEDFRRSIENRLREGSAGAAIARLRALLASCAGPGGILPERFLTVESADLELSGWDALGNAIRRYDMPGRPITAISIAFGWPGEEAPEPDAAGCLRPHVETSYFSDNAFPFSQSSRDDLLEGYSFYGCTWSGDSEANDNALSLHGIDDLHGALAMLEARLLACDEPDEDSIRAGSLGACLLSALLVQAVTERIARDPLPRPLCVMAGSSGVYPYFDTPVAGIPEKARKADAGEVEVAEGSYEIPAPRYSSLLMTGIPRAKKRAVLVLEESENELANRIARLRGLNHDGAGEDETPREEAPVAPAIEQPDPVVAAARDVPLLARKPDRPARDLYDMLGLRQPDPPAGETPPHEPPALAEPEMPSPPAPAADPIPVPTPIRSEQPVSPGFALLDADQQQRMHWFLWPDASPIDEATWPERSVTASVPRADWPVAPERDENSRAEDSCAASPPDVLPADPVEQSEALGMWAQLLGKIRAGLARFGL